MSPPLQFQSTEGMESHSSAIFLHGDITSKVDEPHTKRSTSAVALYYWCYALHALLFIIQATLLAMLWHHPERSITIALDNSTLTIGLSAFLQAFYTLYAALLVFLTQRLALSSFLLHPQKLTAIHDISGAWAGLGAAATTLWRQTSVAASTWGALLIFLYLSCVFILHVAAPTVMEFVPYTATATTDILANSTWPSASVNLSSLNTGTAGELLSFLSSFPGLSTDGLSNSTLYDTFNRTPQMVNASVNAHTIRANCGLLQILSSTINHDSLIVNTNGVGSAIFNVYPTYMTPNQVSFPVSHVDNNTLVYMVSTSMLVNNSIGHNVSLDILWNDFVIDSQHPNTSTTVYIVACSLKVSNYTSNLDFQSGNLMSTVEQPDSSSQAWSLWAYDENSSGTLDSIVTSAYWATTCNEICTLDPYLMTLLGISQSNSTAANTSSLTLTPYQFENALSQMAAQLVWIAGQFNEDGGYAPTENLARVTEQVPGWRLNINTIPVVFTLSASFILLVTALILGVPLNTKKDNPLVKGSSMLEMLWVGAHSGALRKHLNALGWLSSKELRSAGMFDVLFTKNALSHETGSGTTNEAMPLLNPELGADTGFEDPKRAWVKIAKNQRSVRWPAHRHHWCYLLHGLFVLPHVALLLLLIRHPERCVVLQSVSGVSTIALAASLQFFYVVYTLVLVFLTQQLAVSRAIARTLNLTNLHDLSQAWTGIGSALVGVWQQVKVTASLHTTLAIATYYLCVSVIHITSTTVMQFEVFNSSINHTGESALAWPASLGNAAYNWSALSPIVPLDQFPSLSTKGLVNGTVYDVPTVDSTSVNATVNATTIRANCGLLSNVSHDSGLTNATVPTLGIVTLNTRNIWKDTILFFAGELTRNGTNFSSTCSKCDNYLLYLVTTALEVDPSLKEVGNVSTVWNYTPPGGNETSSNTTAYVVACSLNATTTVDVLDVQNYFLPDTDMVQSAEASRRLWSIWSPVGSMGALGSEISSALSYANAMAAMGTTGVFTSMDAYTMSLVGLNLTANDVASLTQSSADPSVTLWPSQLEDAISQIAAQYVWAAGQTNGSYGPAYGSGESVVTDLVVMRRLNVNAIPVVIASAASLVLFFLAVCMVGLGPSTVSPLSELGVLETLWLESHSDVLHGRMRQVANPTLHDLRVAGMFEVCLADEVRDLLDVEIPHGAGTDE